MMLRTLAAVVNYTVHMFWRIAAILGSPERKARVSWRCEVALQRREDVNVAKWEDAIVCTGASWQWATPCIDVQWNSVVDWEAGSLCKSAVAIKNTLAMRRSRRATRVGHFCFGGEKRAKPTS